MELKVEITSEKHISFAMIVCKLIKESAIQRGIGRGKRKPDYVAQKIKKGEAIIATHNGELAGFSYLDTWDNEAYVVNTGLIVVPQFRSKGLAKKIKAMAIELAASKYPTAKLMSMTTSLAVMKMNTQFGYEAVTYSELPKEPRFWEGCRACPNYGTLKRKNYKMCFCTAMILEKMQKAMSNHS